MLLGKLTICKFTVRLGTHLLGISLGRENLEFNLLKKLMDMDNSVVIASGGWGVLEGVGG